MPRKAPTAGSPVDSRANAPAVLVVDDDPSLGALLDAALRRQGYAVELARSSTEARTKLNEQRFALILLDVKLGESNGLVLLRHLRDTHPAQAVVVMTGYATVDVVIEALRQRAVDFLVKPFEIPELVATVERAMATSLEAAQTHRLEADLARSYRIDGVIGRSPRVREAYRIASIVAPTDATVLIMGETGTGKELLARSIHLQSRRAGGPLVALNCGAVPETLLEAELFGHERGAFTGALTSRPGRFERAQGGTLFLDEVGEMSPGMQVRLLRVLQDRMVERVGGTRAVQVDCRIIAATNKNLYHLVREGKFREDLYYRLAVVPLRLPPLRERLEDLPLLVEHFLQAARRRTGRPVKAIDPEALRQTRDYPWPGNIRELEHCIERAVLLCQGETITSQEIWMDGHAPHWAPQPSLSPELAPAP